VTQEEMTARKHVQLESLPRMHAPSGHLLFTCHLIVEAAKSSYGAIKGVILVKNISFKELKISSQQREKKLHHVRVSENYVRRSAQFAKFLEKQGGRQVVNWRRLSPQVWGSMASDKELQRMLISVMAQLSSQLEADKSSHTVAKEGEGDMQMRREGINQVLYQRRHICECEFPHSALASRELNWANFDPER